MLSVSLIIGFAFFLDACFGFGGVWLAIPLLTLSMLPKDAVFLMLVFQCMKVVLLIPAWRHINWKSMNYLFIGMFFGVLLGISILDVVSPNLFKLGLAIYLLLFVISEYANFSFEKSGWMKGKSGSVIAGFFGGIISGVTGMGAPPYVTYLRSIGLDKLAFRATIICVLSISSLFRLIMDFEEIVHNEVVVKNFVPCLVAFALVSVVGSHIPKFLPEKVFKTSINAMLLGASLMLFYKSFV